MVLLLLKATLYNIALLPKIVTNCVTWLLFMESNVTLCYLFVCLFLITRKQKQKFYFRHM